MSVISYAFIVFRRDFVACFGVKVSMTFNLNFACIILAMIGLLSGQLLGKSYTIGLPYVLFVVCLLVFVMF